MNCVDETTFARPRVVWPARKNVNHLYCPSPSPPSLCSAPIPRLLSTAQAFHYAWHRFTPSTLIIARSTLSSLPGVVVVAREWRQFFHDYFPEEIA